MKKIVICLSCDGKGSIFKGRGEKKKERILTVTGTQIARYFFYRWVDANWNKWKKKRIDYVTACWLFLK